MDQKQRDLKTIASYQDWAYCQVRFCGNSIHGKTTVCDNHLVEWSQSVEYQEFCRLIDDSRDPWRSKHQAHTLWNVWLSRASHEGNEAKFYRFAEQWDRETMLQSDGGWKHPALAEIIRMGDAALPFIMQDLQVRGPHHWFWALYCITGHEIEIAPENSGKIDVAAEAWLKWGKEQGII